MVCVTTVLLSALTLATRRHSRSTSALSSADCYSGDPRGFLGGQIQCFRLFFCFLRIIQRSFRSFATAFFPFMVSTSAFSASPLLQLSFLLICSSLSFRLGNEMPIKRDSDTPRASESDRSQMTFTKRWKRRVICPVAELHGHA